MQNTHYAAVFRDPGQAITIHRRLRMRYTRQPEVYSGIKLNNRTITFPPCALSQLEQIVHQEHVRYRLEKPDSS